MSDARIAAVLDAVMSWKPLDDRGVVSQSRLVELLKSSPAPFSREAGPDHITASAVVLSSAGVLLHKHKLSGLWFGPGGHVDGDEWPWEAAQRETLEETGIHVWSPFSEPTALHLDVHDTVNGHVHYDIRYLFVAKPDTPNPPPGESQEVAWFDEESAAVTTDFSYQTALLAAYGIQVEIPR